MLLKKYPLIILLLANILGICLSFSEWDIISALLCSAFLSWFLLASLSMPVKIKSLLFIPLFTLFGFFNVEFQNLSQNKNHFSNTSAEQFEVQITEIRKTNKAYAIHAVVLNSISKTHTARVTGKLLIYTKNINGLDLYSKYAIPAKFKEIEVFRNPEVFNYGQYLNKQNFHHQTFIDIDAIVFLRQPSIFRQAILNLKNQIVDILEQSIENKTVSAFLQAILIGQKEALDKSEKALFQELGLAHILAVSGMHVGIILILLNIFFRFIPNQLLKLILILTGIWVYILITGAQVPAVRAGFMLSLYQFGKLGRRQLSGLNIVLFSAFILLVIDPDLLFSLSFQYSYAAMISIVLFFPIIRSLFFLQNGFLRSIWELIALNFSVQILIIPISLFHFGQYSLTSIPLSLFFSPLLILIYSLALVAILFAFLMPMISTFLFKLLELGLIQLLSGLEILSQYKYIFMREQEFGTLHLLCFMVFILFGYAYLTARKRSIYKIFYASIPLLCLPYFLNLSDNLFREITIHDIPAGLVIDISDANGRYRYGENHEQLDLTYYAIEPNKNINMLNRINYDYLNIKYDRNVLYINDQLFISQKQTSSQSCVIINPGIEKSNLCKCKELIFTRNISKDEIIDFESLGIPIYSIKQSGAKQIKTIL